MATEAAAVLGNADEDQIRALREYGKLPSTGFQIIGDLLDFQGDEATMASRWAATQEDVTLPVLYYLRDNPDDDRVARVVGKGGDDALVAEVVAAIRGSDAIRRARERADGFVRRSQEALAILPEGEPRDRMAALAEYTASRRN